MKTETMKLSEIKPAPYNPRIELKEGDVEYEALKNSIGRFGLVEPLIVNQRNGTLIGGHQRYNVLKANGVEETDVVLVDLDEKQEKELNISLNKIEGEWDDSKLEQMLAELSPEDVPYTGFSEEEIESIIGINNEQEMEEIVEQDEPAEKNHAQTSVETETVFDMFFSFPNKEDAEKWLKDHGIDKEISDRLRSITIYAEDYDV